MSDDLDRLVDAIESEGPSPEFVAALRQRIVAATEARPAPTMRGDGGGSDEDEDGEGPGDAIPLRPARTNRPTAARLLPFGAVAAAIALVVGLVMFSRGDDRVEPVDQPTGSTLPSTTTRSSAIPPVAYDPNAPRFSDQFAILVPGTYRIDAVGAPFSLTVNESRLATTGHASAVIAHADIQSDDDRSIRFMRLTGLSDPQAPAGSIGDATSTWPADDFDGWLGDPADGYVVSNRADTMLGGLPATRIDLELGDVDCGVGPNPCGWFGTNRFVDDLELSPGAQYRIWMVDQGEHDPLAVVVAIDRPIDRAWFDAADAILSTLAFGEVGPNPIVAASAGRVESGFLGGVGFELGDGSYVVQEADGVGRVRLDSWPGGMDLVTNVLDREGGPLVTTDAFAAAVQAGGVSLEEIEPETIGGLDARVFDVDADAPWPVLRPGTDPDRTWSPPQRGRLWAIEHPERGLLVVVAGAFENRDIVTPLALELGVALVETIEFIG